MPWYGSQRMSAVTKEEIYQISALARLALERTEIVGLQQDLSRILDHMEALSEVDTEGVVPMTHIQEDSGGQNLRADICTQSLYVDAALSGSTHTEAGCFSVPAILTTEDGS